MKTMPFSLGNIILLKEKGGMRKSIPSEVDKKSGGFPKRGGSGILKKEERAYFFLSIFLRIIQQ